MWNRLYMLRFFNYKSINNYSVNKAIMKIHPFSIYFVWSWKVYLYDYSLASYSFAYLLKKPWRNPVHQVVM